MVRSKEMGIPKKIGGVNISTLKLYKQNTNHVSYTILEKLYCTTKHLSSSSFGRVRKITARLHDINCLILEIIFRTSIQLLLLIWEYISLNQEF